MFLNFKICDILVDELYLIFCKGYSYNLVFWKILYKYFFWLSIYEI